MPSLRWKVQVKPSSDLSQDCACPGTSFAAPFPSSSHLIRPSDKCWIIVAPSTVVLRAGSIDSGSDAIQTSSSPSSLPGSKLPLASALPSAPFELLALFPPPQAVRERTKPKIKAIIQILFFIILPP